MLAAISGIIAARQQVLTDPYFSNVELLLHADEASGSTSTTDSSLHNRALLMGNTIVSNVESKFGGTSLATGTNGIKTTEWVPWQFGSSDFTIEGWYYLDVPPPSGINRGLFGQANAVAGRSFIVYVQPGTTLVQTAIWDSSSAAYSLSSPTINVPVGEWFHFALVRHGTRISTYVNGSESSFVIFAGSLYSSTLPLDIGNIYGGDFYINTVWSGYIDEFRVTSGVARYTTNFAVPTAPFPNS